jgi:hypothetical protein
MRAWVAIIEDRHFDTVVELFSSEEAAITCAVSRMRPLLRDRLGRAPSEKKTRQRGLDSLTPGMRSLGWSWHLSRDDGPEATVYAREVSS